MKQTEHTTDKPKPGKGKILPFSGSDLSMLAVSLILCGLFFCLPSTPTASSYNKKIFKEPVAAYVHIVYAGDTEDTVFKKRNTEADLISDEFALQTSLPPPETPAPKVLSLSEGTKKLDLKPLPAETDTPRHPVLSDLPAPPVHPYAEAFSTIINPEHVLYISPSLQAAGFSFSRPTNEIPATFSFSANISIGDNGKVQLLLVDTQSSSDDFLPWQNALMLSTATNSASGKITLQ